MHESIRRGGRLMTPGLVSACAMLVSAVIQAPVVAADQTQLVTLCAPPSQPAWTAYATGAGDPCSQKRYIRTVLSGGTASSVGYNFDGLDPRPFHIWIWVGHTYSNAANVHYHVDAQNFSHGGYIDQEAYTDQWVELSDYGTTSFTPTGGQLHVSVDNTDTNAANRGCPSGGGVCYVSADAIAASTGGPPGGSQINGDLNDYPWAAVQGGDPWGMAYGECVSYTAWKAYETLGGRQHPPSMPAPGWRPSDAGLSPISYAWGNADAWAASARARGVAVDHTPRVGDVAQWDAIPGTFELGHTAFVYAVHADGSIDIAQYNLRLNQRFSTLHLARSGAFDTSFGLSAFFVPFPSNFIHLGD